MKSAHGFVVLCFVLLWLNLLMIRVIHLPIFLTVAEIKTNVSRYVNHNKIQGTSNVEKNKFIYNQIKLPWLWYLSSYILKIPDLPNTPIVRYIRCWIAGEWLLRHRCSEHKVNTQNAMRSRAVSSTVFNDVVWSAKTNSKSLIAKKNEGMKEPCIISTSSLYLLTA